MAGVFVTRRRDLIRFSDIVVEAAVARRAEQPMLAAGIWYGWREVDGSILRTFAVITTNANDTVVRIHHRMPVIIDPTDMEIWLGDDADATAELMRPAPNDVRRVWRAPRTVNDVRRDGPELLEPMEEADRGRSSTGS
jgi:putative SOS response-associated peptidase YedK